VSHLLPSEPQTKQITGNGGLALLSTEQERFCELELVLTITAKLETTFNLDHLVLGGLEICGEYF